METLIINGGKALRGSVEINGAKNAAVAIIPAALMVDGICRLENVPKIKDVVPSLLFLTIPKKIKATTRIFLIYYQRKLR